MSAVDAAVAVADAYGLRCDKPVVLGEAWHVLVHLRPWPVVARVTSGAAGVDPADRRIHDSLADYDGELSRGRAAEVRAMLAPFAPSDDVELVRELASRELPEGQALHGDAHLFNCIQTATRPVWHDLETACRGPREYDLAALVLDDRSRGPDPEARAAIAAYGPYDEDILERALPVYASWLAASFMVAVARRPDAAPALERQLRFLRRFRG